MGRVRTTFKGPRIIDLDILLFENYACNFQNLIIPHPEMTSRAFVLKPLLELDPHLPDPRTGVSLAVHLDQAEMNQKIVRVKRLAAI